MKTKSGILSVLAFLLLLSQGLLAAENQIKTTLTSVKLYLSGAELIHTASVKLKSGIQDIVFTGFADEIDGNSIRVKSGNGAVIMAVMQRMNYLSKLTKSDEIKFLQDSIEALSFILSTLQNEIAVLDEEYNLLLSNKVLSGKDKATSAIELKQFSDFFRERLSSIKEERLQNTEKIRKIQIDLQRLRNQISELNAGTIKPESEIVVTVSAKSAATTEFEMTYLSNNASWQPCYDIRVADVNSDVVLIHKANITQNTGLEWKDVALSLSNRNPVESSIAPEFHSVYLDFLNTYVARQEILGKNTVSIETQSSGESVVYGDNAAFMSSKGNNSDFSARVKAAPPEFHQEESAMYVEFTPELKYTIPSDGKEHQVEIQTNNVPAVYEYYSFPKFNLKSYLVAKIKDWEKYNLLPGDANVYFKNSFLGASRINTNNINDTLLISLGEDRQVGVTRDIIKDFTEDKFFSDDIERTFAYKITLKNNKNTAIKGELEDLLPISRNESIKIKLIEKSGAEANEETGKITWKFDLEPQKSIEKKLIFSIRYPKNKKITHF
ncbi:MAG: Mucoidy inhibitor MuiA family protein [Ignavibacteria bacterium]|nr:Mucoidy inhibitor MuiA family protein [Ignavibacteria bacterium]